MPRRVCALLLAVALAGCMEGSKPTPLPRVQSLYARMGGEEKLREVVERVAANVPAAEVSDPVKEAFAGPRREAVKRRLVEQLGARLGGPYQAGAGGPFDAALRGHVAALEAKEKQALHAALDEALGASKLGEQTLGKVKGALQPGG